MGYPKTAEQWWWYFDTSKAVLRALVRNFHPWKPIAREMPITATGAEMACDHIRREIANDFTGNPLDIFDKADTERDGAALVTLLNETWFGLPESMDCHSLPGFGILCDLCSEAGVLGLEFDE